MAEWSNNLERGLSIEEVRNIQPEYFTVKWDQPDTVSEGEMWFEIVDINGNRDVLVMQNFLAFEYGKNTGRESIK